jgi:succinate dehydrogenase/fumarate reductase cytochrome b subunit
MGATSAMTIATMNAMNNANNNHYYHYTGNEGTTLIAFVLASITVALLWIAFTSIRQLIKKDVCYDFVVYNTGALITIGVVVALTLFFILISFIYTLIQ